MRIKKRKSLADETGRYNTKQRTYDDPENLDNEDLGFLDNEEKDNRVEDDFDDTEFDSLEDEDDLLSENGGEKIMDKHQNLLRQLTNFEPYLKDVVNGWLGLVWDEKEEKFVRQPHVEPIMNLNGAAWCVSFLKTYTRENNIITDINKDHYSYIVTDIVESVWYNLGTRDQEFGIKNEGDILRIAVELQHAAELVLMGAGDGRYNKFLGATYSNFDRPERGERPYGQDSEPIRRQGFFNKIMNKIDRSKMMN